MIWSGTSFFQKGDSFQVLNASPIMFCCICIDLVIGVERTEQFSHKIHVKVLFVVIFCTSRGYRQIIIHAQIYTTCCSPCSSLYTMGKSCCKTFLKDILHHINPLRARIFRVNINIYLHFMSFLCTNKTQVVEIPPRVRQGPAYTA